MKVPIPEKRINFAMKVPINLFGSESQNTSENHVSGWSFISPNLENTPKQY